MTKTAHIQADLLAVVAAEQNIIKAGFPFIKFELETHLFRSSSWTENKCEKFIDNFVGPEYRKEVVYRRFYRDGSVDSELTITLPTDKGHMIVKWMEAFNALAEVVGNKMNTDNAGLHIAVLTGPRYPCPKKWDKDKLANFVEQVTPLLPAMIFLSSHNHKTRGWGYRKPIISADKYSAIAIRCGVFEYRIFDVCYDRPTAVYDKISVIAATLKYYSARKHSLKLDHTLRLGQGGVYQKLFNNPELLEAMEKALEVVRPRGKTLTELKKERNFKLHTGDFKRAEAKLEAKIDIYYKDAVSLWEKKGRAELRSFRMLVKGKKGWKSLETDDEKAFQFLADQGFMPKKPSKDTVKSRLLNQTSGGSGPRIEPVTASRAADITRYV